MDTPPAPLLQSDGADAQARWPIVYLELTGRVRVYLQRFAPLGCHTHPQGTTVHLHDEDAPETGGLSEELDEAVLADTRWPTNCGCGRVFDHDAVKRLLRRRLARRSDTGEVLELEDAPIGAVWDAYSWLPPETLPNPQDGRYLICNTPYGPWQLDSLTVRQDEAGDRQFARLWEREGDPLCMTVNPELFFWDEANGRRVVACYRITDGFLHTAEPPFEAVPLPA